MASPIPHKEYVEHWSVEQVSAWLQQVQLAECREVFLRRGIDGHSLMQINEESLLLWPDVSVRNRRRILKLISQINDQASPAAPKQKNLPPGSPWAQCAVSDDDDDDGFTSDEFDDSAPPANALKSSPFISTQSSANNHRFGLFGTTESVRPPRPPRPPRSPVSHHLTKPRPVVNSDAQPANDSSDDKEDDTYLIPNKASEPVSTLHSITSKYGEVKIKNTKTKPLGSHNSQAGTTNYPSHSERHQHSNVLPPTRQTALENKWRNSKEDQSNDTQPVQTSAEHEYEQVLNTTQTSRYPVNLDKTQAPPKLPPRNPPSEATGGFRTLGSPRQPALQGSDTGSSSSSTSAPFLPDSVPPAPTATAPSVNTANRRQWGPQENIHGSPFPKGSSVQLPIDSVLPMRSGFNPSPLGTDKGYTRHIPPKNPCSAPAKTSPFPPPPPVQPKPSLPSSNSSASDSETKVTNLETLKVKCFVSIGEGETVFLEQIHIDLMNEPWFHLITRKKAAMCVMNSKDGTFLIRPSTHNIDPLTLCLRYQGRTYNIPIRQRKSDKCFALGKEKANELAFETVPLLVETYHKKPIRLDTGDRTLLTYTPPKVLENVYVKHASTS